MKLLFVLIGILFISCQAEEVTSDNLQIEPQPAIIHTKADLQTGDLIFHTSHSSQSQAIQIATNSKYSHMGMIFKDKTDLYVYEAVQPVKITKLQDWINRGKDGKYVVKRLKRSADFLTPKGIQRLKLEAEQFLGKDYDLQFKWSDEKIYCSELVWKIYKNAFNIEIGKLEQFGDFDLSNEIVQMKVKERYSDEIPKEELVITPDRMFHSTQLITIKEH